MLIMALVINIIIIVFEMFIFIKLKDKRDIFKYYTFLQNFIALMTGIIFVIFVIMNLFFDILITEFIRGLRYMSTCGLLIAMFVYVIILRNNDKNALSKEDFNKDINPNIANIILHYLCPLLSLLSFIIFERSIPLTNSIWTGLVSIPSCLYWITYVILSATKLWKSPYEFVSLKKAKKNNILEFFIIMIIPLSFLVISYILWNIK